MHRRTLYRLLAILLLTLPAVLGNLSAGDGALAWLALVGGIVCIGHSSRFVGEAFDLADRYVASAPRTARARIRVEALESERDSAAKARARLEATLAKVRAAQAERINAERREGRRLRVVS